MLVCAVPLSPLSSCSYAGALSLTRRAADSADEQMQTRSLGDLVSTRMLSASKRLREVEMALILSMVTSEAEIPAAFAIDCSGAGVGESTNGITREGKVG